MQFFRLLGQFLRSPRDIGSVAPSSQALAKVILQAADIDASSRVVELGPGTGVLTEHLSGAVSDQGVFFALELNPELAEQTKMRCPSAAVYTASATDIAQYLALHNQQQCDCIVSSLPWGSLPNDLQDDIFDAILAALPEGGRLVTFSYIGVPLLPAGRGLKTRLKRDFSTVEESSFVWGNIPPAFVYSCIR